MLQGCVQQRGFRRVREIHMGRETSTRFDGNTAPTAPLVCMTICRHGRAQANQLQRVRQLDCGTPFHGMRNPLLPAPCSSYVFHLDA